MIDQIQAHLALRNRLLSLVIATTGSTTLSATTTGYARAAGSFVTDGFHPGMEITPTGFTTNTVDIVTRVEALALTTKTTRSVEASAGSRTIACNLPALRAWENVKFEPASGRPYIEEDFVPGTAELISMPYANGAIEETGLYVVRLYNLPEYDVGAIRKSVNELLELFTPGTQVTNGSTTLRVRGDVGPRASQIEADGDGWMVVTVEIPWLAHSTNAIAA